MLSEGVNVEMGINHETKATIGHDGDVPVSILCAAVHSATHCKQLANHTR